MDKLTLDAKRDCFVNTNLGPAKGSKEKSQNGKTFCAFRGIPYAQAPIGELRFKAPQERKPWKGVLNARHDGPLCIQKIFGISVGSEDCLYLNVYAPEPIYEQKGKLLPVVIYIHGGKFTIGSGVSFISGPTYLMNEDLIVVTTNYRLGVLGFFSTGDDFSPGNYGMKDQVAAMRWVRDNIAEFGGDPDKVTLQGESAGSKSVHFHMFSPLSKGLFHGAISQSGSAFMPWVLPPDEPLIKAKTQAKNVRCLSEDIAAVVQCLRKVDAKDLVRNEVDRWQPVLETESPLNPKPFLTSAPLELVKTGNFSKVPWMMGTTAQDGAFFGASPKEFFLNLSVNKSLIPEIWKRVKDFYFTDVNNIEADELIKLYTDRFVVHAVHKATVLHTYAGHAPVFQYNFAYRGLYSFSDVAEFGNKPMNLGVVHMDDLIYLIPSQIFNVWPPGHPDRQVIDVMVTLWTNFIRTGNPTPPASVYRGLWKPLSNISKYYLEFGHDDSKPALYGIKPLQLDIKENLYEHRMEFWDSLPLRENK
ncbi:Venom carboxylesterase-6 [Blattella germanica]|nr:Venom carboxylesterase-6 [Blattella germanica]